MKCPIDNTDLVMSERQGIEIDYCPACRGVWLDRGELDKIIERTSDDIPARQAPSPSHAAAPAAGMAQQVMHALNEHAHRKHYKKYDDDDDDYRRKKKKSLLTEIFDF